MRTNKWLAISLGLLLVGVAVVALLLTRQMGLWGSASVSEVDNHWPNEETSPAANVDDTPLTSTANECPPLDWETVHWAGPSPNTDTLASNFTALLAQAYNAYQEYEDALYNAEQTTDTLSPAVMLCMRSALHSVWGNPNYILSPSANTPVYVFLPKAYSVINEMSLFAQRRGALLLGLYQYCRPVMWDILSKALYYRMELDYVVHLLHRSYYTFADSQGQFQEAMAMELYYRLAAPADTGMYAVPAVEQWLQDTHLPLTLPQVRSPQDLYWAYGFWARRTHEGNQDAVYYIIRDIRDRYK